MLVGGRGVHVAVSVGVGVLVGVEVNVGVGVNDGVGVLLDVGVAVGVQVGGNVGVPVTSITTKVLESATAGSGSIFWDGGKGLSGNSGETKIAT